MYKFIKIDDKEKTIREIFQEAFIQLVLSSDNEMGASICGIEGMYRAAGQVVIKLEYIEHTLLSDLTADVTFEQFSATLTHIHTILMHFRKRYNFHHRDFHAKNIMLKDGKIKLIDFGESCITYFNKTFSKDDYKCESADFLILLAYIYEYSTLSKAIKAKIRILLGKAEKYLSNWRIFKFGLKNIENSPSLLANYDKDFLVKLESVDREEAAIKMVAAAYAASAASATASAAASAAQKQKDKDRVISANDEFKKEYNSAWTIENIYDEIGKLQDYYSLWKEYKAVDQLKETYNYAINLKKYLAGEDYEKEFPAVEIVKFLKEWQASFKDKPGLYTPQRRIIKLIDLFIETNEHILNEFKLYPKFLKTAILSLFETESILLTDEKIEELLARKGGYRKRNNTKRRRQKRRKTTRR